MQPSSPAVLHLPSADIQPGYYDEPVVTSIGLSDGRWSLASGTIRFGGASANGVFQNAFLINSPASGLFSGDTGYKLGELERGDYSGNLYPKLEISDAVLRVSTGEDVVAGNYLLTGSISLKLTCKNKAGSTVVNAPFTNLKMYASSTNALLATFTLGDDGNFYPPSGSITVPDGTVYFLSTVSSTARGTTALPASSTAIIQCWLYFNDGLTFADASDQPQEPEYNGLLNSIIEWLKSIKAGITGIVDAITGLPGLIVDGIKGLFVPSQDALQSLKGNYETLFEGKFGFIYQLYNWVVTFFGDLKTALTSGAAYAFTFPGIAFPMDGETITILDETAVSLDNSAMTVLRPVLGTAVSFIVVIATVNTCRRFILRFLSGHIFGGGGDEV